MDIKKYINELGEQAYAASRAMASISTEKLKNWKEPAQAEELPDINLGDFGNVSVGELIDYYIENPPAHSFEDNTLTREIRFKGC